MFGAIKKRTTRLIPAEEVKSAIDAATLEVGGGNFDPKLVLYEDKEYSIALGMTHESLKCGIRLNGVDDPNAEPKRRYVGFPNVDRGPKGTEALWFLVPDWLTASIVQAALERKRK